MLHDVLYNVVRGVVGTCGLALPLVVLQENLSLSNNPSLAIGPFPILFIEGGERHIHLTALLLDNCQLAVGDTQLEFQEPFVDRSELADAQRFVVNEDKIMALWVHVPGEEIKS